jgi:HEAT repeat protein
MQVGGGWQQMRPGPASVGRPAHSDEDQRAIDPLQVLLRDNNSIVRDEAANALQTAFDLSCSASEGCKER